MFGFFDGSCHCLAFPFDSVWFALETVKMLNATQTGMHSRTYSLTRVVWAHIHMHTYSYLSSHANVLTRSLPTHSYVLMHAPSHTQRYTLMCHLTLCFAHTFICTPPCMHIHTDSDVLYCTHVSHVQLSNFKQALTGMKEQWGRIRIPFCQNLYIHFV